MIKNFLETDTAPDRPEAVTTEESETLLENEVRPPALAAYSPPTSSQAIRMTGLAWSAGIALFGSILVMLIVGWFADLLLGSSPWGKVAGIVIGSIIGFIQFFRINSEILRAGKGDEATDKTDILR